MEKMPPPPPTFLFHEAFNWYCPFNNYDSSRILQITYFYLSKYDISVD